MESSAATELPELDSLPDGFLDSSTESAASVTLSNEIQKPLDDCKSDKLLNSDELDDPSTRASKGDLDVSDGGCVEESEDTLAIRSDSAASASSTSDGCNLKTSTVSSREKGGSDAEATCARDAQISENQKSQKETTEVKRKSSKWSFKTEQEFLEFTLKYKRVLEERDAAIAVRGKLESLCRELQRQNKLLMDECRKVSEEGQNLRLDLSAKFQDVVKEVSVKLEAQKEECLSQLKENEMLKDKLKQLADQHSLSQQQYAQELKQKTLELTIAELKAQQNEEKLAQEQAQVKLYVEKISLLLETEKSLRLQLAADGEKFQQFQDALLKSNQVFATFKQEMEKMTKLTRELEKENNFLKSKCEKSDLTLIELVEERENLKKQLEKTKKQKQKLESLCRSLQGERKQSSAGATNQS